MRGLYGDDIGDVWPRLGGARARHPWPAETVCSAGPRGLVFSAGGGTYRTLFIEVYPPGASFIRGEGATAQQAEDSCWAQYQAALSCPGSADGAHDVKPWRTAADGTPGVRYHNGAGFCSRCATFVSAAFTPDQLGQWCAVCGAGVLDAPVPDGRFLCAAHRPAPRWLPDL